MLAFCKLNTDRAYTRLQDDDLRERESDTEVELTCDYLAKKVGYVSTVSGWSGRIDLEDTGFIDITKHKFEVDSKISYQDAKEKYPLHQGIQEETGLAYYYDKRLEKVYGVKCYELAVNAYAPICYRKAKEKPAQTAQNSPKKRWEKWYEKDLKACDGLSIRKMFGKEYHLFEIESISDYLYELLERNENFFYGEFVKWNSKKDKAVEPNVENI